MCAINPHRTWISGCVLAVVVGLAGCATSQDELLPTRNGATMDSIWHQATGPGTTGATGATPGSARRASRLDQARSRLRRPLIPQPDAGQVRAGYTRDAANEIHNQFQRLPNPDLTLYIFPHLSDGDGEQVPVPGYTTVFPMYTRPHYAQPGEHARTASLTP